MSTLSSLINRVTELSITIGNALQLQGFKPGGAVGQVPVKLSGEDFDWSWQDVAGGIGGVSDGNKGDITVSGSGLIWDLNAGVVTLDNLADLDSARLIGRYSAGTGVPQAITIGGGLSVTGGTLVRSALTGDVTASAGSGVTALSTTGVTAGSYTLASITVDAKGRITAAASGSVTNITGNAATATALETARAINGVSFNGTANITVPAAGSTLTDTVPVGKGGTGLTAIGSALQVLRVNAGGTALEYATVSVGGGDALTSNPLSQFAATTSAQLAGVISDETGTGALVFANSPILVTPNLGTPSTVVLTNATGTAAGLTAGAVTDIGNLTGVVTSTNRATAIADAALSIAKTSGLQAALDGKVSSGGALGTPSSGALTNCTGLPASAIVEPYVSYVSTSTDTTLDLTNCNTAAGRVNQLTGPNNRNFTPSTGMPVGASWVIEAAGTGVATVVPGSCTLTGESAGYKTAGQYARLYVEHIGSNVMRVIGGVP